MATEQQVSGRKRSCLRMIITVFLSFIIVVVGIGLLVNAVMSDTGFNTHLAYIAWFLVGVVILWFANQQLK